MKPHVAVCRHCGAILDEEKAAKHESDAGAIAGHEKRVGTERAEKKVRS